MNLTNYAIISFLIFSRISGIFLLTPIFGGRNLPLKLKIGFSVFLTYIILPIVTGMNNITINNILVFLILLLSEFLIGLVFGFISLLIMNSIYIAGVIVDRNIGFSIVNVISPQDESQIPVTANLYYVLAMLIFLISNSHHLLIKSILYSFNKIPLGYEFINIIFINKAIGLIHTSFILGFKMAAPVIITIFITNVLLGILSRAMPQMNVFVVGMPLKIFIGLITLYLVLPLYLGIFENIFTIMFDHIRDFINSAN